ncbi:glycosyltransferase [candidate division WWE3 bacterium]|uniref:Glycosyltransferase n=1 Tax=candidate division WWE3 bacterium TaxID=2053526 RepID=A0A955RQJ1_UNCKA|nr:glycosyltransferase [candidate division WWE3 bacterium]
MKVALVHDFLNTYGGAERLLYSIHQIYPEAPIFTTIHNPSKLPDFSPNHLVIPSKTYSTGFVRRFSKPFTFLLPLVFEQLDLSEYDLIISSTAGFAKGIVTRSDQLHICYCHTPPRFLYKYEGESNRRMVWYYAPFVSVLDSYFRIWDEFAASRVDLFVANSQNTARRIKKYYRREAEVIYPPVNIESQKILERDPQDFYLLVSRLSAYKHVEIAIEAANKTGKKLTIVGTGPEEERLKALSGPTVTWEGFVTDERLAELYSQAKALIYTVQDEDFGMTPIEAMSYGCPVIGHRSGGLLESIQEYENGMFFDEYTSDGLVKTIGSFDSHTFEPQKAKERAKDFSMDVFKQRFSEFVNTQTHISI